MPSSQLPPAIIDVLLRKLDLVWDPSAAQLVRSAAAPTSGSTAPAPAPANPASNTSLLYGGAGAVGTAGTGPGIAAGCSALALALKAAGMASDPTRPPPVVVGRAELPNAERVSPQKPGPLKPSPERLAALGGYRAAVWAASHEARRMSGDSCPSARSATGSNAGSVAGSTTSSRASKKWATPSPWAVDTTCRSASTVVHKDQPGPGHYDHTSPKPLAGMNMSSSSFNSRSPQRASFETTAAASNPAPDAYDPCDAYDCISRRSTGSRGPSPERGRCADLSSLRASLSVPALRSFVAAPSSSFASPPPSSRGSGPSYFHR